MIIAAPYNSGATAQFVNTCKIYGIQNVACIDPLNSVQEIFWLDSNKSFITYLETNLIDSCNLNCKSCMHYSNLFTDKDIYNIDDFARDVRRLSENADVVMFRLLGGEPLKIKNLDQYIKIARRFFPNTNLRIVTNGLLIPTVPQKIFDALRENNFGVDISVYKPTMKIYDKIVDRLVKNNLPYRMENSPLEHFTKVITLHGDNDPLKSRKVCLNDVCRFLRNGKIYKCPIDALSYKFVEHFNIKNFPSATGVDLYAKNFSLLLEQLNGNIELCSWCGEESKQIAWKVENKPKLSDWIVDLN